MKKVLTTMCVAALFFGCARYYENRVDKDFVGTGGLFDVSAQIAGQGVGIRFFTGTFATRPVGSGDKTSFKVEEGVHADVGEGSAGLIDKRVLITQESAANIYTTKELTHGQ